MLCRPVSASIALAALLIAGPARADEPEEGPPAPSADDVTVRIDAGNDYVTLGGVVCPRGSCVGRVPRGRLDLVRQKAKGGELVKDFSTTVVIDGPSAVRIDDPGALHTASWITLGVGAAILIAGIVLPGAVCRDTTTTGFDGLPTRSNPCDGISDPVKIGYIAAMGGGITLALVGGIGVVATNRPPRAAVRPWQATATGPRISLSPFGLRAVF